MKIFFFRFWPVLFILSIWFLFSYPYFVQNKVPYPSEYQVNFFPPWSQYQKNWGPVKNNAMPDVIAQIYPWKHFSIESLKKGQIPFWNPNNFAGNPHVGNFQSAVFSPFNLFYFVLPFVDAWSVVILLQPLLAGLFTYLFIRSIGVGKIGSLIASACYMFCGFIVVWMAYGTLSMTVAFLPFILLGIEQFVKTKKYLYLLSLCIGVPMIFFSGHFQMGLYVLLFSLVYSFFRILHTKKYEYFILVLLGFLVGLIISLVQLIPTVSLYAYAVRSEIFTTGGGIPFQYLITAIAPDFYGNPVTRNDWVGSYAEWASFIGIIPFFLALFAIFYKRTFFSLFFTISSIVIILLAIDTPLQGVIGSLKIPVISTSNPTRIIFLFSFSMAILAGIGMDTLKELIEKSKLKKILRVIAIFTIFFLVAWGFILILRSMDVDKLSIAKRNLLLSTVLFIAVSVMTVVAVYVKKEIVRSILFILILLSVSFESLRFAQKWMPFDPKEKVFMSLPVISAMQKNIGNGRVFGNLGYSLETYYNLPSLEGYDPLYVGRVGEFMRASLNGELMPAERSVVKINRDGKYTKRILDLTGVNVIFHPKADSYQSWAFPVWNDSSFSKIYEDDLFELYRNKNALNRTKLFYSYEVISDKEKIIKKFFNDKFDFKKTLILEQVPDGLDQKNNQKGSGKVKIVLNSPNKIIVQTQSNAPSLLFLSDTYFSNWRATVNGKKVKIYRADYAFRAVVVPKGKSDVVFYYDAFAI